MRYQPVGQCIYCGAPRYSKSVEKLSLEHIVPFCVDGDLKLPESSCEDCSKRTCKLEGSIFGMHGTYRSARVHAGSKTRGGDQKVGEMTVPLFVGYPPNQQRIDLQAGNDPPKVLLWIDLPAPVSLQGADYWTNPDHQMTLGFRELNPGAVNRLGRPVSPPGLNLRSLGRLIAKVAHGYAVAELGITGFQPLLADFIRDKTDRFPWGLWGNAPTQGLRTEPFALSHEIIALGEARFVVVDVHLLATVGFPNYRMIVGTI